MSSVTLFLEAVEYFDYDYGYYYLFLFCCCCFLCSFLFLDLLLLCLSCSLRAKPIAPIGHCPVDGTLNQGDR